MTVKELEHILRQWPYPSQTIAIGEDGRAITHVESINGQAYLRTYTPEEQHVNTARALQRQRTVHEICADADYGSTPIDRLLLEVLLNIRTLLTK